MSYALGPVVGNRVASANKVDVKPHLRQRLQQQRSFCTPMGTVSTGADGRQAFKPNYVGPALQIAQPISNEVPHRAFRVGQRVRVHAAAADLLAQAIFPFDGPEAATVSGREGAVVQRVTAAVAGLVAVEIEASVRLVAPCFLAAVPAAEGDEEREAMNGGPTFDPYAEPLSVGDTVQWVDGRIGNVTAIEAQRLGVAFEGGSAWLGSACCRGSLRLLAKAPAIGTCPF